MALVAADAQRRRRLGTDGVDALKARLAILLGARVLVVAGNDHAWAAGKGIAHRHFGVEFGGRRAQFGTLLSGRWWVVSGGGSMT